MIGVGNGPLNGDFKKVLVAQVTSQRYAQMHGTRVSFTVPQRVAYILSVLGMRPQDAPRYQEAFEQYRKRYFEIRKDVRGLETGACAWICYHSLETLGRLEDLARYELVLDALNDPPEAVDGFDSACNPLAFLATPPHASCSARARKPSNEERQRIETLGGRATTARPYAMTRAVALAPLLLFCAAVPGEAIGADVVILASKHSAKSANIVPVDRRYSGLVVCNGVKGMQQWDAHVEGAGAYYIHAYYASADPRAVTLPINGRPQDRPRSEST